MSHAAVNWVINEIEFPPEVKPSARWLLVQIADRASKDEWTCFPSHKTLAKDAGMTPRSVLDWLFVLEAAGLITRTPQFRDDGQRSTDLITLVSGYATVAGPGRNIPPDQPQHSTPDRANVAALNLVTEPGKITDLVLREPDPFETWWAVYPLKVAKVAARKAWAKATPAISALTLAELMERTRRFAEAMVDRDPEHIAHAATWLNGERWNDELNPHRSQTDGQSPRYAGPTDHRAERDEARAGAMLTGAQEALDGGGRRRWRL